MESNLYDLDVALTIVNHMFVENCKKINIETDSEIKEELEKMNDIYLFEKNALYKGGDIQASIIDKAFRLYAPIVKEYYAS